ncbi:MAG: hypothetical protein JWR18_4040 [Segetibacter sp.]|nr:hypothetical protein [Segetibacter sp.]
MTDASFSISLFNYCEALYCIIKADNFILTLIAPAFVFSLHLPLRRTLVH